MAKATENRRSTQKEVSGQGAPACSRLCVFRAFFAVTTSIYQTGYLLEDLFTANYCCWTLRASALTGHATVFRER